MSGVEAGGMPVGANDDGSESMVTVTAPATAMEPATARARAVAGS